MATHALLGAACACASLCVLPAAAAGAAVPDASSAGNPLAGRAMWIWTLAASDGGRAPRIARRARTHGIDAVIIKAAHGTHALRQLSRGLIRRLQDTGIVVCGYHRSHGREPAAEARAAAQVATRGADCLVVDAEAEYERLPDPARAARRYMRALRGRVGPHYPVGMTSFPYASLHRRFPFRAFFGRSGAQYDLPQVYWRALGDHPADALGRAYREHARFGRPILPIGQTWMGPAGWELRAFERHAAALGAEGVSYWSWQSTSAAAWASLPSLPYVRAP
jgi:hypothetical protein